MIDTGSNVALKGRSLYNHLLTIIKGLKLVIILLKKKEKKHITFLSKKRFRIPMVPVLVPGHLKSKRPYVCLRLIMKEIFLQKGAAKCLFYTPEEVLKTALKKHAYRDQFCYSLDDFVFCYPDQHAEFTPGTTESFIVEKCMEEFSWKPYSKMNLFLCSISVYGNCNDMKNSKK